MSHRQSIFDASMTPVSEPCYPSWTVTRTYGAKHEENFIETLENPKLSAQLNMLDLYDLRDVEKVLRRHQGLVGRQKKYSQTHDHDSQHQGGPRCTRAFGFWRVR